jgi:hypothetical protein
MPLVTIVEEVMDFSSIEAATGVSHSTQFVRKLEAAGRSVVVFMLDHGIFTGKPRCRWYIAGVSPECGGEKGAKFIQQVVQSVVKLRTMQPPTKFAPTVVDPESADGAERRLLGTSTARESRLALLPCGLCSHSWRVVLQGSAVPPWRARRHLNNMKYI